MPIESFIRIWTVERVSAETREHKGHRIKIERIAGSADRVDVDCLAGGLHTYGAATYRSDGGVERLEGDGERFSIELKSPGSIQGTIRGEGNTGSWTANDSGGDGGH